ncbi:MAG: PSD1 and planctomycete cytochrome C domain-containing protein [Planctomycetia bacterium]|nr:PSD1 and planctomycete cytochrome C domain-containing protein [Planctomycetia bacterium]
MPSASPSRRRVPGRLSAVAWCLAAWGVAASGFGASPSGGKAPDFNRDIRPILSQNCFACHGPDEHDRRGGLRLDDRDAALAELDSAATAIVPGHPDQSELIARIHETDPDTIMPPPESNHVLTAAQKELLARWIAAGAPYAAHWAYVAPTTHAPPPVRQADWGSNWIDPFILGRLEEEGIEPAADADPLTLLRRVTFDLTGLPPSPQEVDAYLADTRPDAYMFLVDRLLASPRHAERMAAWWLDLVRYADTVGYHGDQPHNISPYRDWVIKSFRDNVPFDRFTVLQLAGDLVGPFNGEHADDPVLASAYNRLLQTTHEGGLQAKEYRAIYQADRIRNVSGVWMGATVGCAQCHDHKYDPYTARDFHALGAFFADIDDEKHFKNGTNALPTRREPEVQLVGPFDRERATELDARMHSLDNQLPPLVLPPRAQPPEPEPEGVVASRIELDQLKVERQQLDRALMVTRALKQPRDVRVLPRGNWLDETGPIVEPAIPGFLGSLGTNGRASRADLARWLTTPVASGGAGEYTARVTANRIWALFFGAGLCRSAGDFGGQGELPDHPELLDRLAIEFLASGWDVKQIIRTIVTSRAYRMSSAAPADLLARDPDNRLLARQGRWRLPAEGVRDTALFACGLLVERLGGESVHPYQPAGYYQHLNFPQREYKVDKDDRQWRRGLYVHWQRMFLHPQLLAFDAPSREECTATRMRSNTPKAALVLLNDPTFIEAARKLAELALAEAGAADDERIAFLWKRTLSRGPDADELALVKGLLDRRRVEFKANPQATKDLLAVGVAPRDKTLDAAELAAWTATARAVLNLHEAIARY